MFVKTTFLVLSSGSVLQIFDQNRVRSLWCSLWQLPFSCQTHQGDGDSPSERVTAMSAVFAEKKHHCGVVGQLSS